MSSFDDWLAAMPPAAKIESEIAEIEARLEKLRLALRLALEGADARATPSVGFPRLRKAAQQTRKMRAERIAVLDVIAATPEGMTPADVAEALGIEMNAAATRMSRMVTAGQLQRVAVGGRNTYRLPAHLTPDDLKRGKTLFDPSGSEGSS